MTVQAIPAGYHQITPYLIIKGAAEAIEFYKNAFGAVENFRMPYEDGRVGHAELKIGDSLIMLADEFPEMNYRSPVALNGSPIFIHLYVEDVDTIFNRAVHLGAQVLRPIANQFFGDRSGAIIDPFGHRWSISTHIEDVSPEEIKKRLAAKGLDHKKTI